ncbi:MAG TPA: glycosyl transferase family 4 [Nanoarchaeota archaeon]|nr:MAG: UDP-N-acetylglucosamine-dolichyl-phosphate N-acetylglucosaminephosphotransferase [archaeon GW2011_AR6]HIH17818.1 glycosyl transferase family 4 [Nanoarchaeota archaeon]HIH34072.1 glycosyl transferase family 4 [Nanoarchaeota archaeon]HIH51808.1 glycosyl transferase family 4 [Nanoarchaeota archaeon]HIH66278.1 glycosyl transferase family 4 [Nanoarchaeota archaeon]
MALALVSFVIAFLASWIMTPIWIRKAKALGLAGKDIQKKSKESVAEAGGIVVIFSTLAGVLFYIFINTFVINVNIELIEILGITITFLLAGFIGFIDDILGWKVGLKQFHKFLLSIPIAIPLAVLNAGTSDMTIPLFGTFDFGILYPLLIVPLGVIFATNSFNMLAGMNGIESGNAIIILSTLAFLIWKAGAFWASVIAGIAVFALLAFFFFNKYPAKVFPGDTLTYSIGALIAAIAITGNAEKAALILFFPYFIEFLLKARGKFKKESFARVNKDGTLDMQYRGIYSLTHLSIFVLKKIKGKAYEKEVVYSIWALEIALAIVAIAFS